jgi:hypothetical protein
VFTEDEAISTSRQIRILGLLDAAEHVAMTPLQAELLHTIAYFADALSPVWDLPILDAQFLKRARPYFPALQADLDVLVAIGMVVPTQLRILDLPDGPRLEASYALNRNFADPVLRSATDLLVLGRGIAFIREVVFAVSALGLEGISTATEADVTYANPMADLGSMIDIDPDEGENPTAAIALRFGSLLGAERPLQVPEMVHLYVRQLYARMLGD